jgi:hypothetical protein
MLPQVIFPHWLRLGAAKVAASDIAAKWVIEDMAAAGMHSLRGIAVLFDEEAHRVRCAICRLKTTMMGAIDV